MEFSGAAQPDTSDITSSTKFTAHFKQLINQLLDGLRW